MKISAAVAETPGTEFQMNDLELATPNADEILVKVAGVGICHTDIAVKDTDVMPIPLPAVLGH